MAKLYFYYSAMNAGKSTTLLQSAHNYRERGMHTLLLTAGVDDRYGTGSITSRLGISAPAELFGPDTGLFTLIKRHHQQQSIGCVLVDEAQFLTQDQVFQLSEVVDRLDIPVLTFGIRTDFQGELFSGSQGLLAWADKLIELKTICHCGSKANMVIRVDDNGEAIREGSQIEIGGNDRYLSVCRKHFKAAIKD